MKKVWLLFALMLVLLPLAASAEGGTIDVRLDADFLYDQARGTVPYINQQRTNNEKSWYWNRDNTTKTTVLNLKALTYDAGLETIAMQRAAEIAVRYDVDRHLRPDNSKWSTIYNTRWPTSYTSTIYKGECIAAGPKTSAAAVINWWAEQGNYAAQLNRRTLLNEHFTHIGVGCVRVNGNLYWTILLSSKTTSDAGTALSGPATVQASLSVLQSNGLTVGAPLQTEFLLGLGATMQAPGVQADCNNCYTTVPVTLLNPAWQVTGDAVTFADGMLTGVAEGSATLSWSGASVACTVREWSEPEYAWALNEATVTATRAKISDPSIVETETVKASVALTPPANAKDGVVRLSSLPFLNPAFEKQNREVTIPALSKLRTLRLPLDTVTVAAEAFAGTACQTVILPEGCASIGSRAFADCTQLLYIHVPEEIEVADDAFAGCVNAVIDRD